jgi:phenylacetate-CoA ligase
MIAELRADPYKRAQYVRSRRRELLTIAATSPYYHELFNMIWPRGIPDDSYLDSEWQNVPLLTKEIIRAEGERLLAVTGQKMGRVTTSGSSGQPLAFLQDEKRSVAEFAYLTDAWSRAGFTPGDLRCVFRCIVVHDAATKFMELEPALAELRCSPFELSDSAMATYFDALEKHRIGFIQGYASAITIFASFLLRTGRAPFTQIRGIFPISEKLLNEHRRILAHAFPAAMIVPTYGLSEKVAFAAEAPGQTDVYEFDSTYGLPELVDENGHPVEEVGVRGAIVGSGFITKGMPFIRYATGDEATLVERPSYENGYKLVVADISSRFHGYVVSKTGARLYCTTIVIYPSYEICRHISEFQLYQDQPGIVELRVVLTDGSSSEHGEKFANEMRAFAGAHVDIVTRFVESIPTTQRGKRKLIDQQISIL